MIPMDTCHVLLGRPWLFSRGLIHDSRLNTYTFTNDHRKITLTPFKPSHIQTSKGTPQLDVFLATLLRS